MMVESISETKMRLPVLVVVAAPRSTAEAAAAAAGSAAVVGAEEEGSIRQKSVWPRDPWRNGNQFNHVYRT